MVEKGGEGAQEWVQGHTGTNQPTLQPRQVPEKLLDFQCLICKMGIVM